MTELVAPGADIGSNWSSAGSVSLGVDSDGTLLALYFDYATHDLRLSRKPANGTWAQRAQPLASPANAGDWAGAFSAMAIDSDGLPHLAYTMETSSTSALWSGTLLPTDVFTPEQVDPPAGTNAKVGFYVALALDAAGGEHLAYDDTATADLKYAWRPAPSGAFTIEVAQSQGNVGAHASIAVDANRTAHVLSFELVSQTNGTGQLRYATRCR